MISEKYDIDWARDLVQTYIGSILNGDRNTCRHERYAVERYLHDREHAAERGWSFNETFAANAVLFFPRILRHTQLEWAGQPFEPTPWQAFLTWQLQGWRDEENLRRFLRVYVTVARKNGKTTWASAQQLQVMYADYPAAQPAAQYYCSATSQDQARILWDEAVRMIKASPVLSKLTRVYGEIMGKHDIRVVEGDAAGSFFRPLAASGQKADGFNPAMITRDEIHAWTESKTHRDLLEKLRTGGGSQRQACELTITTAGDDNSTIWREEHEYAEQVVERGAQGEPFNDRYLVFICQIEAEDDWSDINVLQKANPNYGVCLKPNYLQAQVDEAIGKPSMVREVIRYHGNRQVSSHDQAYPAELWELGAQHWDEPKKGAVCFAGMDLGRSDDWAAASLIFPRMVDGQIGYKVKTQAWACQGPYSSIDYTREPFQTWIQNGQLLCDKGEVIDYSLIKAWFREQRKRYHIRQIEYDDTFAKHVAEDMLNVDGLPMHVFFQTYRHYTEPSIKFEQCLKDGLIDHGDDAVLNWQASNAQYVYDPKGLRMLDKGNEQRHKKIDAMVATLMAFDGAIKLYRVISGKFFLTAE